MHCLALGYSDFFGTENVPDGEDPNEEDCLDLAILRLEVRNLMRTTEQQVGCVKLI